MTRGILYPDSEMPGTGCSGPSDIHDSQHFA
jgi:hypothetical protein